jgi:PIN domain nuclease of toxin-antitoxin system
MKLLLDTCTFLWLVEDSPNLSNAARAAHLSTENEVFLSSVSAWEIGVKHGLGKLALPEAPAVLVPKHRALLQLTPLPFDEEAALLVSKLPHHHRDPFDRMLVCQALAHGMAILSPDPWLAAYPVPTIW